MTNSKYSGNGSGTDLLQNSWKNFTSANGYSISYPQEWNLTVYDNETYIQSDKLDAEHYPIMAVSVRYMDPIALNNSILNVFSFESMPNQLGYSSLFNDKILSNIGLKYYVDLDYIVVEPTQEGKYMLDGKQGSAFKVHKLGDNYETEHITVNNNGSMYNVEITYDSFPSSAEEEAQIKQYKENILKSIKWTDETKIIDEVQESEQTHSSGTIKNTSNGTKDEVLNNNGTDSNGIIKIISSSESDLNITSSTNFFDGDDLKIVGEVLNKGPNIRELVKVVITLYNDKRNVIGTELTYTEPTDISPQQSAPFEIIIGQGDVSNTSAIKSFKLYLTSDVKASSNNNQQSSQGSTPVPLDSFNTDIQSPFDSNNTGNNPLEKLMNLFKYNNSSTSSDALSSNFTINESTVSMYPDSFRLADNIVESSIVPGASVLADTAYDPNPISIHIGQIIRWTNNDTAFHTVTSGTVGAADAGKTFDSGLAGSSAMTAMTGKGKTFEHTFNKAGEYPYFCTLHPFMVGKIIVQ